MKIWLSAVVFTALLTMVVARLRHSPCKFHSRKSETINNSVSQELSIPIAIAFKYVTDYTLIWTDSGSGADRDVSFWRPYDVQSGYFHLGDAATASHGKPSNPSLTVTALVADALAPPAGFSEVWNDQGSGADRDVRVMRMNPPSGYTCLGYVAVIGYGTNPDRNRYRCVKTSYVIANSGTYVPIWNDRGSGANSDVSLYSNANTDSDYGIDATTFTAFSTYSYPSGRPSLLSSATAKVHSLISSPSDQVALIVYQITNTETIWTDSGSGADRDFSSNRAQEPDGYYSLGDIGVASHSKPSFSIVVKEIKEGALATPTGFRQRWNDGGSGADDDVAFYEPICPGGYRVLGYVTIRSHHTRPSTNDVRCVKRDYVLQGNWKFVWDDSGSGADRDVAVWEAVPSGAGQGVRAMSARPCHCGMDRTAYVLNPAYVQYIVSKPVKRYFLSSIIYEIDDRDVLSQEPETLARTTLINNGASEQEISRTITYHYEESYSWSHTAGLEIGVSITVEAGIPDLFSTSVTTSITTHYSYTTGGSATESKEDSITANVKVKGNHFKVATITSKRYIMDLPFSATVTPQFTDDSYGSPYTYKGIYEGVQVNDVTVTYGPDVSM